MTERACKVIPPETLQFVNQLRDAFENMLVILTKTGKKREAGESSVLRLLFF